MDDESFSFPPHFEFAAQRRRDEIEQVYMLAGFWIESALYGIYFVLFMGFTRFTLSRRSIGSDPLAKRVFTYLITVMFILSTYWMGVSARLPPSTSLPNSVLSATVPAGVNIYRFLEAYALMNAPGGLPIYYFRDFSTWYNFSYAIISSMLFWIADFLAPPSYSTTPLQIYRCFIIWDRSYRIVALPFLLLVASIGTNGVNFHFFLNGPKAIPNGFRTILPLLDFVYPGHLGQNVMTTALIAYKIWRRHSESRAAGIRVTSTITLLGVARIVVESAMIYTMQMLALVVLHIKKHPLRVVFQAAIVPSTDFIPETTTLSFPTFFGVILLPAVLALN
ncbi:hypothetical protein CC1G_08616 [Coprinopsis cinerea okayama7|uniref:Uncharacterized protein n=1 Tax=Coprinopsis cinerea (strain Okayama-7 / 130 / ATCC MYA-4618 / FGSC 9003) TaxID=240176 RepID=A8NCZ4_COPC7|nr:hypothetical protein CC1G_08616 [Coprinopsis cinerea okayama7\|eukprot:XP_001832666.2 hypothetical protein CC1G_08616 [Coprinopsis cinerea okayama7\